MAPIQLNNPHWTYDRMRSWNMIEDFGAETLVDIQRQGQAHAAAE